MEEHELNQMIDELVERDMASVTMFEAMTYVASILKMEYQNLSSKDILNKYKSIIGELH
tara:strand:- start:289 stop:465 length:177 start_codon:yes stop_codon:yes gene_type:complete